MKYVIIAIINFFQALDRILVDAFSNLFQGEKNEGRCV